jgi:ORF6N domain
VKRNLARFPRDFIFRLTKEEAEVVQTSRSQTVTLKRGQNVKYLPYAFTEHGALMAATVLNSSQAVKMSVYVIRAFVKSRDELAANSSMVKRLAQIDNTLFLHDSALRDPWLAVALAKAALSKTASTSCGTARTAKAAHWFQAVTIHC